MFQLSGIRHKAPQMLAELAASGELRLEDLTEEEARRVLRVVRV